MDGGGEGGAYEGLKGPMLIAIHVASAGSTKKWMK